MYCYMTGTVLDSWCGSVRNKNEEISSLQEFSFKWGKMINNKYYVSEFAVTASIPL